jgi:hypothetical protein
MNCPDCDTKMSLDRSFTGNIFGDWLALELLFWVLLIPLLMLLGALGWFVFVVLFVFVLAKSLSKKKYKCKDCGYELTVKKNNE